MVKYPTVGLLILFMTASMPCKSQHFLRTEGISIVNASGDTVLLRGMGLGGWMLQEGYMLQTSGFADAQFQIKDKIEELVGPLNTQMFYDAWLANHMRKIDLDTMKSWGFNSVRLPMHYNLFTLPIEDEPIPGEQTWLNTGFELTDSLISWCAQNEMYVILDLHAAPGGQGYESSISDYDPEKPSLWESDLNKEKTVMLWKRLAERYADEQWVGGYDLLNEPNWNLANNSALRDLYVEITNAIRSVDNRHIIFIEGNWFANDFTGLTPPWDDNMVYSPHKYWSYNVTGSIQWVLSIRDEFNVPIYFGEWGENSNTWFREAIRLFEEHDLGWACWPLKKIESIAGPLSVVKAPEYQTLLDYWRGQGNAPSVEFARGALMGLTEDVKLENCVYQRDVIDAMFRQVKSEDVVPFRTQNIPGVVYATDFDLGPVGSAYFDVDVANYQVSTGNFTAWNEGWLYRNDGVDIQACTDLVQSNGYNVAWMNAGEWMQYDVSVALNGIYDIHLRLASNATGGKFHFSANGADISKVTDVPNTGSWQNWQTVSVPDVILSQADRKLRFFVDNAGFNASGFEFEFKGESTAVPAGAVSAKVDDENSVLLVVNKRLTTSLPMSPADFEIFVDGNLVQIQSVELNLNHHREITFGVDHTFQASEVIQISYSGTDIQAEDGTLLEMFQMMDVDNTIAIVHALPGRIEADDYFFQSGVELENTSDVGGGQNVGHLDGGDYMDYYINVPETRAYRVDYRTAALTEEGKVLLQLVDDGGEITVLHGVTFPPTGGWQSWTTTSKTAILTKGVQHLRVAIDKPLFNLNWFEFTYLTSTTDPEIIQEFRLSPNPGSGLVTVNAVLTSPMDITLEVYNLLGQPVFRRSVLNSWQIHEVLDLHGLPAGHYILSLSVNGNWLHAEPLVLVR
jgi:hypothetical protein